MSSNGSQKPAALSNATGLICKPSCCQVQISKNSSSVPMPPGSATNASPSSAIRYLRACILGTTSSLVSRWWGISADRSDSGMTPWTSVPAAKAVSASTPIRPTSPPPKTTPKPRSASACAKASTAPTYASVLPCFDPVNTVTRSIPLDDLAMRHRVPVLQALQGLAHVARILLEEVYQGEAADDDRFDLGVIEGFGDPGARSIDVLTAPPPDAAGRVPPSSSAFRVGRDHAHR